MWIALRFKALSLVCQAVEASSSPTLLSSEARCSSLCQPSRVRRCVSGKHVSVCSMRHEWQAMLRHGQQRRSGPWPAAVPYQQPGPRAAVVCGCPWLTRRNSAYVSHAALDAGCAYRAGEVPSSSTSTSAQGTRMMRPKSSALRRYFTRVITVAHCQRR